MVSNDATFSGGVRDILPGGSEPPPESPHHALSGDTAVRNTPFWEPFLHQQRFTKTGSRDKHRNS
jgi:hypothetical protein